MGLLANLFHSLRPNAAQRSTPSIPDYSYQYAIPFLPSGIYIDAEQALQISVVFACVDAISKAIASCPWPVITRDGKNRQKKLPNDPIGYLLNVRPNDEMTAIGFREALMICALTWGNGYAEIVRDGANRPAALYPLEPDRVCVKRTSRQNGYRLYYEYSNPDGGQIELAPNDVYHLHGPGISGLMGDNMVARMAKAIGLAAAAERFASTYFGNNTVVGGVLETDRILNNETHDRMKKDWEDKHKGPDRAHKIAILENGLKFKPIDANADKAQLVESRKFQVEEICRFYGVPPHKVQALDKATFSNIEHQSIEWVRDGLTPWARRLEQEADFKLFSLRGPARATKLETAWLSMGDAQSRAEAYRVLRETGVLSVNEIREKEGENDIGPEGDVRLIPLNMQTVAQLETAEERARVELENAKNPPEPALAPGADTAPAPAPKGPPQTDLLRDAVEAMFATVFDRYDKRLKNRAADLERTRPPKQVVASLASERKKLRPWLVEESASAIALSLKIHDRSRAAIEAGVLSAADDIDNGESPTEAARRITASVFALEQVAA